MRYTAILAIVCLGALTSVVGCDDGNTTGDTMSSSSSGAGGEAGSGGAGGGGSTGGSGGAGGAGGGMGGAGGSMQSVIVNGCDSATAQDETANTAVTISFGADLKYTPACIRVKKGTKVTFQGAFSMHPLAGGLATLPPQPDGGSPIQPTASGTAASFTMNLAGNYGFYCEYHVPNMAGAVFVE